DRMQSAQCDQLTLELEDFVRAARDGARPRVLGEDGLNAVVVAQHILRSLSRHAWENDPDGPVGPFSLPEPMPERISALPEPKLFRYHAPGKTPSSASAAEAR